MTALAETVIRLFYLMLSIYIYVFILMFKYLNRALRLVKLVMCDPVSEAQCSYVQNVLSI